MWCLSEGTPPWDGFQPGATALYPPAFGRESPEEGGDDGEAVFLICILGIIIIIPTSLGFL